MERTPLAYNKDLQEDKETPDAENCLLLPGGLIKQFYHRRTEFPHHAFGRSRRRLFNATDNSDYLIATQGGSLSKEACAQWVESTKLTHPWAAPQDLGHHGGGKLCQHCRRYLSSDHDKSYGHQWLRWYWLWNRAILCRPISSSAGGCLKAGDRKGFLILAPLNSPLLI